MTEMTLDNGLFLADPEESAVNSGKSTLQAVYSENGATSLYKTSEIALLDDLQCGIVDKRHCEYGILE